MIKRNNNASIGCQISTEGQAFPLENLPEQIQDVAAYLSDAYAIPVDSAAIMALTTALGAAGSRGALYNYRGTHRSSSVVSLIEVGDSGDYHGATDWLLEPILEIQEMHEYSQELYARAAIAAQMDPEVMESRKHSICLAIDLENALAARLTAQYSEFLLEGRRLPRKAVMEDALRNSFDQGLLSVADAEELETLLSWRPADQHDLLNWIQAISRGTAATDKMPVKFTGLWLMDSDVASLFRQVFFKGDAMLPALVVPASTQGARATNPSSQSRAARDWSDLVELPLAWRRYGYVEFLALSDFTEAVGAFRRRVERRYGEDPKLVEVATSLCRDYALLFATIDLLPRYEEEHGIHIIPRAEYLIRAAAVVEWQVAQHIAWMCRPDNLKVVSNCLPYAEQIFAGEMIDRLEINPTRLLRILTGEEPLDPDDLRRWKELVEWED